MKEVSPLQRQGLGLGPEPSPSQIYRRPQLVTKEADEEEGDEDDDGDDDDDEEEEEDDEEDEEDDEEDEVDLGLEPLVDEGGLYSQMSQLEEAAWNEDRMWPDMLGLGQGQGQGLGLTHSSANANAGIGISNGTGAGRWADIHCIITCLSPAAAPISYHPYHIISYI